MIKKTRRKIVIVVESIIAFILIILCVSVVTTSYVDFSKQTQNTLSRELDRLFIEDGPIMHRPPSRRFSAKINGDVIMFIDFDQGFFEAEQVNTYIQTIIFKKTLRDD